MRRSLKQSSVILIVAGAAMTVSLACGIDAKGKDNAAVDAGAGPGPTSPIPTSQPTSGTSSGNPTPSPTTPTPSCTTERVLSFDGINDVVTVADDADLDLTGSFTVEAWIKPGKTVEVSGAELTIASHHDLTQNTGWDFLVNNQKLELRVYGTGADSPQTAGNDGAAGYVVTDRWAHVAGTYDGTTLRVYYNGSFRDQEVVTPLARGKYRGPLMLGRASYSAKSLFHGMIDDVRISTVARYTGSDAPKPTGPLPKDAQTLALWRFDEASGDTVTNDVGPKLVGTLASTGPTRITSDCITSR